MSTLPSSPGTFIPISPPTVAGDAGELRGISRESVEFLLQGFGAAYSMLPPNRNADRQKVITAAHQAMAEREKTLSGNQTSPV